MTYTRKINVGHVLVLMICNLPNKKL